MTTRGPLALLILPALLTPLTLLRSAIARHYGTWRGAVRAALALLQLFSGRLAPFHLQQPHRVRRVVFVCLGNICRSAYAQQVAERLGMASASVGLSTSTGAAPPESAIRAARLHGYDMAHHRATDLTDFDILPGDLLLVMEVRQAHALLRRLGPDVDVEIALLGLWCEPKMPHLHDPYTLSDAYFDRCYARLDQAVAALHRSLPHLSQPKRDTTSRSTG
jgi:protein-tyrosine phosphatase